MPQRPRSHVIADIAVSRVVAICNQLGWACETILKDYGEDLWIQTTIGDKVDHHRIWFQVKATDTLAKFERKDGKLVFRVDVNHALRWARCLDLVVFVLWDIQNDIGYWILPQDNLTDVDLMRTSHKSAKLVFDKTRHFTSISANKISWMARIDHYETLMAIQRHRLDQSANDSDIEGHDPKITRERLDLICYDFLRAIGFQKEDGKLDGRIAKELVESMKRLSKERDYNNKTLVAAAVAVVILGRVQELADCGLPGLVLLESTRVAGSVLLHGLAKSGVSEVALILGKGAAPKKQISSRCRKKGRLV
jgi:hypothetical protein